MLAQLQSRFAKVLASYTDDVERFAQMVKPAQDARFGDFQANFAMPLAKELRANPRDLAAEIVAALAIDDLCLPPQIAGPGFINLTLRDDWLETRTNQLVADDRLGISRAAEPGHYIVDFSAPNVAKPMHVGHLRSTVIGAALYRIFEFLGHKVTSDNHVGDWGTQFGMIIYGYKHFVDEKAFAEDAVRELARLYRLVNQLSDYYDALAELPRLRERIAAKAEELKAAEAQASAGGEPHAKALKKLRTDSNDLRDELAAAERKVQGVEADKDLKRLADSHPDIAAAARNETAKLHAGDAENVRLWRLFLPKCLEALQKMYDRLDVRFDLSLGESYYQPMLADVVADLEAKGIARESQGAICVFLEGHEAPFIIRKQDGAFTYATTDLATIKYRVLQLHADAILYVVDARQSEHFRLLFGAAEKWGFRDVKCRHVSFGTILGDDKRPFKTRSGDTVGLESLIDEAIARARNIVDENDDAKTTADGRPAPELDEQARADVAAAVGIGGLKYADLHHNRESDYVFSWDKMLAKTGDTATYMQYSYARICGIFRKGEVEIDSLRRSGGRVLLASPQERSLALLLNRFAGELESAARECRPNLLTQYLFETANGFSAFYEACPVLKEEDDALRSSRLLLCDLTARVLSRGLSLLGIRTCERM